MVSTLRMKLLNKNFNSRFQLYVKEVAEMVVNVLRQTNVRARKGTREKIAKKVKFNFTNIYVLCL